MKHDKSLEEVWKWKDEVYKETRGLHGEDLINYFRQQAKDIQKKYNLHLKRTAPSNSHQK